MDGLLLAMVAIWAGNYSVVKAILREIPPLPFMAVRLAIASAVFLGVLAWRRSVARRRAGGGATSGLARVLEDSGRISRRDWLALVGLGFVGHFLYQLGFVGGLARTSVANSALIIGCSPIAIALLTAIVGHERVGRLHWLGAALSVGGIYLVAARGAAVSRESLVGDLLMLGSVCCWAIYTVSSRALLARHSPLVVTGYSMALGTALVVLTTLGPTLRLAWSQVSAAAWLGLVASALLALNLAYLIWYTAVQRIGNARTSTYSNMVPVAAMLLAWAGLGERIGVTKWLGAAAILCGVLLTRFAQPGVPRAPVPPAGD
jgi:drug/metabolite transporter (DMT)-like permease